MTFDQVTTGPIELRYTLTADDLADGFIARRSGQRRRGFVMAAAAPLIGLVIGAVLAEVWKVRADKAGSLAVTLVVLLLGAEALVLLLYWLYARLLYPRLLGSIYRWQGRLILRGNPWLAEPIRATVTDAGVHAGNVTGEGTSYWSQFPLYTETDVSFVLLASKRFSASPFVLPKRGLAGEDAERLRALLGAHCTRRE
jgi:uncharacterized membrane protein YeaQ/YmgE (transglycosylase-associated protein family)